MSVYWTNSDRRVDVESYPSNGWSDDDPSFFLPCLQFDEIFGISQNVQGLRRDEFYTVSLLSNVSFVDFREPTYTLVPRTIRPTQGILMTSLDLLVQSRDDSP